MREEDVFEGQLLEEAWLTLEQVSSACMVEPEWLLAHLEEGLIPQARGTAGVWRLSAAGLVRARRMRWVERDFEAGPETAALVADLLEEMDALRAKLRRAGLE